MNSMWLSGTRVVSVSDGRLTISNGAGAKNNKINFVQLTGEPGGSAPVTSTNRAPVAAASAVSVESGDPIAVTLTGSDADGDALTYAIVSSPQHGTLTGSAPNLTYTSVAGYSGSDSFQFTVRDGALTSAAATVAVTVRPRFSVGINFQPARAPVPSGCLADTGTVYGNRGNGHTYGWDVDNALSARDRNSTRSPDQCYDTLTHTSLSGGGRVWEIAVPNGQYRVLVLAGDATAINSVYQIDVEGVPTVSGTPTMNSMWLSGTTVVSVNDGRLTISNGAGAKNNKINFIQITSEPVGAANSPAPANLAGSFRITALAPASDGSMGLTIEGGPGMGAVVEVSDDLRNWTRLTTADGATRPVIVRDTGAAGAGRRFYRVVAEPLISVADR
jgi:hypothetical protein